MSRYQTQKQALDLEVASGKLKSVVRLAKPEDPSKYAVVYIDPKNNREVGIFTSNRYWSVSVYDDQDRLSHYDDANNRWMHIRYAADGEISSIVDSYGVWDAVTSTAPILTYNATTGRYRHHLRSTLQSEEDALVFIHAYWTGAQREAVLVEFNRHRALRLKNTAAANAGVEKTSVFKRGVNAVVSFLSCVSPKNGQVDHAN